MEVHRAKILLKFKHFFQPNMLGFFLDENNSCQYKMVKLQNNLLYPQYVMIVMKAKQPVYNFAVVTSDGDVIPPFIFLHGRLNTGLQQAPEGGSTDLGRERDNWKILHLATGLCTIPHK